MLDEATPNGATPGKMKICMIAVAKEPVCIRVLR
jgi:hypothetical protein